MRNKVLKVLHFRAGYEVRTEEVRMNGSEPFTMRSAYTPSGHYIGDVRTARRLVAQRGIHPELRSQTHAVCSIGFSPKDGKWYGWSHRAIFGFKVGTTCRKGDCHYLPRRHGGKGAWTAKTTADARRMACDFAEGVS